MRGGVESMQARQPDQYDVAVIGAGVVGCAIARRLVLDGARVMVLEKAADVLDGASKGNSAILHTGFDAPPGSLEQACIARGYREYLEIAPTLGLPVLHSGALVLAWDEDQARALPGLIEKAHANGVNDVVPLTRAEILRREPHLSPDVVAGFEVPGESLIDPWASAHAYLLQALANGATLRREAEVTAGTFDGAIWHLDTQAGEVRATHVINCAGLYGDIVDERLTGASPFEIRPRKGQFVVYDKSAAQLNSAIILPVPTKTTKGVVICRTIFGNLLVGPTAEEQQSRTDAATDAEMLTMLHARGTRMIPALDGVEVTATYAGLRPASEEQDYRIRHEAARHYVCVGGIRSTGLSAALGIARHVAELLELGLGPLKDPVVPDPDRLSDYHPRDWQKPGHGGILCHCELVTRREVLAVLDGPMPPATLQGLKRRTRVCMGRCQGFYCLGALADLTRGRLQVPIAVDPDG